LFHKISDNEIIEGIRRQDDKILNWMYDHYRGLVRHHVLKNSGVEADVSDVFQDSIIVLYNQIVNNELKLTSDLKGYFFGIARHTWITQRRKKLRSTEIAVDFPDEADPEDGGNQVLERIVSRAFQKLKIDSRTILVLFSEGYTYEEIALKMNLKSEIYARRKKYLSKEALMELIKCDPEYKDNFNL